MLEVIGCYVYAKVKKNSCGSHQTSCYLDGVETGRNMSIISIVDKSRSLSIVVDSNQLTNIGSR